LFNLHLQHKVTEERRRRNHWNTDRDKQDFTRMKL